MLKQLFRKKDPSLLRGLISIVSEMEALIITGTLTGLVQIFSIAEE